jgi:predicted O-methyltransferase YrrM
VTDGGSSLPGVQRLLTVLAAGRRVLELGTAYGEGAAAMAATAESVLTIENDAERAEQARARLEGLANVELLVGDWRELVGDRGPFGLVFYDAGPPYDLDVVLSLLEPGGLVVKDDLTPGRPVDGDPAREFLLQDSRVIAVEVVVSSQMAVVVAARR